MDKPSVIVVGAGIGGIASAARLAQKGYRVTVIEKQKQAGGRCNQIVKNGHVFDVGPTALVMPDIYEQTFSDLGERISDHLTLCQVEPSYRIFFNEGEQILLSSNLGLLKKQMEKIEPGSFEKLKAYLKEGKLFYEQSMKHLVDRDFIHIWEYLNPANVRLFWKLKAWRGHYQYIKRYFSDPRLRIAFTFQDGYLSLSPSEAPATFSMMPYAETAKGIWLPKGGMYQIIKALLNIAKKSGVKFIFDQEVKQINIKHQKTTGVTLNNRRVLNADIVIANADLSYVYEKLLPDSKSAKQLKTKRYSSSALVFFWGIKKRCPKLGVHNLFLAKDYLDGFESVLKHNINPEQPNFYLYTPISIDHKMAPKGQDSITIIIPFSNIKDKIDCDWNKVINKTRKYVLKRLKKEGFDLEKQIKFELTCTPVDWQERHNLTRGSVFGLTHNLIQMGYFRPQNQHQEYKNLYFVGASTHPGSGLPTVLISAKHTTNRIIKANYGR